MFLLFGCEKDKDNDNDNTQKGIVPTGVTIDLPNAISFDDSKGTKAKSSNIQGNDIYAALRCYIHIGEEAAHIVNKLLFTISIHNINQPMLFTYVSDEDNRTKSLIVVEQAPYGGQTWDYEMLISDIDGSKAVQMYWNSHPAEGVLIFQPYNCNRTTNQIYANTMYKIEYSKASTTYDKEMLVSISGIPVILNGDLNNLKMFAGKNGDNIDIYGNSNHPNMTIIDTSFTGGRNYAFIARCDDVKDIAVAEIGLPPSSVTSNSNLLTQYSIYNVLEDEINSIGITDTAIIANYLQNTVAPGYFVGLQGFVSCGSNIPSSPSGFTPAFMNLSGLTPYIPEDIKNLNITFN